MLRGINVRVLSFAGFAICGAALGLLGPLIASKTFASAYLTNSIAIMAFVALTLGGIGSPLGALIGGLVLGLLQAFASWYFGALWANIVPFFLYLLILLLRPQGLLGRTRARAV
jgi:branched-chain amino acid transport system permease protein